MAVMDREAIFDFIARDKPLAAIDLDERIKHTAEQLQTHPRLGRRGRVKGTRVLAVHPNYLLIYRLVGGDVEVLRVKACGSPVADSLSQCLDNEI